MAKRMPTVRELMPLAQSPCECAGWTAAVLAAAPFALFAIVMLLIS